jgi:hypothetical protein
MPDLLKQSPGRPRAHSKRAYCIAEIFLTRNTGACEGAPLAGGSIHACFVCIDVADVEKFGVAKSCIRGRILASWGRTAILSHFASRA